MNTKDIYAVVDIETTGTNPKEDRIIQFGCVFIKEGQIISSFAQDINPKIKISKQIENLTGISNQQVAQAPYLEDVASKISQMLENCIFVAHNIYFDYQFLSKELVRCGEQPLTNPGIDTVELAQIFLPTSASFRLGDLAEQYGISHDRPHQADSDAEVTGEILLLITEKMKDLPLVTMEKIIPLADQCGMETGEYIKGIAAEQRETNKSLASGIQIIKGLAIRKKIVQSFDYYGLANQTFPKNKGSKEKLYGQHFDYRQNQSKMMNMVYDFFNPTENTDNQSLEHKNLAIEASTGSGKTFGYLLPLSYLATPEQPVVISTVSLLLESQLVEKDVAQVNQIRPGSLVATLVKSHQHFIDLDCFEATLQEPTKQKQYALYQMGVLVWLTETETGDLDELNLTTLNHLFFKQIKHKGEAFLSKVSAFYEVDFWRHLQKKMAQSNVIVINHAFLCQENYREKPLLPKSHYLIIDEAHHLSEIAQRSGFMQLNDYQVTKQLNQMLNEDGRSEKLKELQQQPEWQKTIRSLELIIDESVTTLAELKQDIVEGLLIDHNYQYEEEVLISNELLANMPVYTRKDLEQFSLLLKEGVELYELLQGQFLKELDKWTPSEQLVLSEWLEDVGQLGEIKRFVNLFSNGTASNVVKWCRLSEKNQQITAYYSDFTASIAEESVWYHRFSKILYTGGTIRIGKDTQYLARNLGIDYIPFKSLPSTYDYSQQARLYVPTETSGFKELNSSQFVDFISQTVQKLARQEHKSILVLFSSHEMLQKVYQKIHYQLLLEGIEVLGQGISGSREKIMKRFVNSNHNILLGTDSFWEGVDIPGQALEIIIVARLPFESPERPFVKEKYQFLKDNGIDSFSKYALPKASLRLRQGLGRLIRSEEDKGVLIVLDRRLVKAKYGQRMIKALPADLPLLELSLTETLADIQEFL